MIKTALLSSKNQITIPKSLTREMGVGHRSKLSIQLEGGFLILKSVSGSIVEETAGSLTDSIPRSKKGISADQALKSARLFITRHLVEHV